MEKIFLALAFCCGLLFGACTVAINLNTDRSNPYLVLVNKDHKLPDNWEEKITLVSSHNPWGDEVKVEKSTLEQFEKLQAALLDRGLDIYLGNAYRSVDEQVRPWDYRQKYLAAPDYSEYQTGLAVDVCITVDGEYTNDNDVMLAQADLFGEVHRLMPQFGFILRYPEGKAAITGYSYEPWHLRYVGDPKIAEEIAKKGLTLEEYLDQQDKTSRIKKRSL